MTFRLFFFFYQSAWVMHLLETWQSAAITLLAMALALIPMIRVRKVPDAFYLATLILNSVFLLRLWPDGANHIKLMLFANGAIGLAWWYCGRKFVWGQISAFLRAFIPLIYLAAAFHKLNSDFVFSSQSCVTALLETAKARLFLPFSLTALSTVLAILVIFWEMSALLLYGRNYRSLFLRISIAIHLFLCLVQFYDFSALMFALFLAYIPESENESFAAPRACVAMLSSVWLFSSLIWYFGELDLIQTLLGLAYAVAMFVIFRNVLLKPAPAQDFAPGTHSRLRLIVPSLLLLYAAQPYLGLSTAGSLTMFSNLRSEGKSGNHFLLRAVPKLFPVQDDLLEVLSLDPKGYDSKGESLEGKLIPSVELYKIAKRDGPFAAIYRYRSETLQTERLLDDARWQNKHLPWLSLVLDFRLVDKGEQTRCRW